MFHLKISLYHPSFLCHSTFFCKILLYYPWVLLSSILWSGEALWPHSFPSKQTDFLHIFWKSLLAPFTVLPLFFFGACEFFKLKIVLYHPPLLCHWVFGLRLPDALEPSLITLHHQLCCGESPYPPSSLKGIDLHESCQKSFYIGLEVHTCRRMLFYPHSCLSEQFYRSILWKGWASVYFMLFYPHSFLFEGIQFLIFVKSLFYHSALLIHSKPVMKNYSTICRSCLRWVSSTILYCSFIPYF